MKDYAIVQNIKPRHGIGKKRSLASCTRSWHSCIVLYYRKRNWAIQKSGSRIMKNLRGYSLEQDELIVDDWNSLTHLHSPWKSFI